MFQKWGNKEQERLPCKQKSSWGKNMPKNMQAGFYVSIDQTSVSHLFLFFF